MEALKTIACVLTLLFAIPGMLIALLTVLFVISGMLIALLTEFCVLLKQAWENIAMPALKNRKRYRDSGRRTKR